MSKRIDAAFISAKAQSDLNMDASEANVFARELLKVRAGVFEIRFPELKAQRLIPKNTDMGPADEEYTYRTATEYGTTKLGSGYTGTSPRADISMVEATPQRVRPLRVSYGYDIQEARIAAKTGNQLPMRKANAARKAMAQEVNRILTFGAAATEYGAAMSGLANLSSTLTYTTPNGAAGSPTWALKTPDEILADMNGMEKKMVVDSNDVEHPNTLLLSLDSYHQATTRRLGDGSDKTILQHFMANSPHITSVEPWYALDAAPAAQWTGRRAMMYRKAPDVLEYLLPVEFEQFAPQMINLETVTECQARIGGVVLYLPKAVIYGDGF